MKFRSTPGHGYLDVTYQEYKHMQDNHPALLTRSGGYSGGMSFEEDVEWARVALAFPEAFSSENVQVAHRTMKEYHPDIYKAWSGEEVDPAESYVLRQRIFLDENRENYIVHCAMGSWHEECPEGFVLVYASLGESRQNAKKFLVEKERYASRGEFGYVVDEEVDQNLDM